MALLRRDLEELEQLGLRPAELRQHLLVMRLRRLKQHQRDALKMIKNVLKKNAAPRPLIRKPARGVAVLVN